MQFNEPTFLLLFLPVLLLAYYGLPPLRNSVLLVASLIFCLWGGKQTIGVLVLALGFIYTMKQFDIIWTLTGGGPGDSSQVLSTWSYTLTFLRNDFGEGAAVAGYLFAASIVVVSFYSIAQRRNSRATQ